MTQKHVITAGEFLGACDVKGYLYSVFQGYTAQGLKRFSIVAVKAGKVTQLLTFTGAAV